MAVEETKAKAAVANGTATARDLGVARAAEIHNTIDAEKKNELIKESKDELARAAIKKTGSQTEKLVALEGLKSGALNNSDLNNTSDGEKVSSKQTDKLAAVGSKNDFDDGFVSEKPNSKPEIAMNPAEVLDGGVGLLGKLKDKRTVAAATAPKPSAHNMV